MKLQGIEFGNAWYASGAGGFFGEGYWFHHIPIIGANFSGATFVSKTATWEQRDGNMLLRDDYTPANPFARCVRASFLRQAALNSVGLSNPGLRALLRAGYWQRLSEPFFISVMSLADTPEKRKVELRKMVSAIADHRNEFTAPFGVQVNLSCPNTGHSPSELIAESEEILYILGQLRVPVMPKYSIATAPIEAIMELEAHPNCDAICVSNTIPFGWEGIKDWEKVWGSEKSPLAHLGGGGLSGKPLKHLVCNWIYELRTTGFEKPINGGGGILEPADVYQYWYAGANSIFIGSAAFLRPWQVQPIIEQANNMSWPTH